nr:NHL repeat-containing protein [uncultured Albidiferax sp.]
MLAFLAGLLHPKSVFSTQNTKLSYIAIALVAALSLGACGGGGGGGGGTTAQSLVAPTLGTVAGAPASVVVGGAALPLVATVPADNAAPASATTWSFTPAGLGSLGQTIGATSSYVPPAVGSVSVTTTVVVTATLNGKSTSLNITLYAKTPWLSLLAGDVGGPGSTDGVGAAARFRAPQGMAIDGLGYIYVADTDNNTVRKLDAAGVVSTLAGTAGVSGAIDGTGSAARFNRPAGIAVDAAGNVYVADTGNALIRKVTSGGVVSTFAGTAATGYGSADGSGAAARFSDLQGLAVDSFGNIYAADRSNHTIRKITPAGVVTTLAGTAGAVGSADGTGAAARFHYPNGVAVDGFDNVYVLDAGNLTVRKIDSTGVVTTVSTGLAYPRGLAADSLGYVYVTDAHQILKIVGGVVTNLAGSGIFGSLDGAGTAARFDGPTGMVVDPMGYVYVADTGNNTIRVVSSVGQVNTVAGAARMYGASDGTGAAASFNYADAIATDNAGNVFVADFNNSIIRKITPAGVVSTFAGAAGVQGSADGTGAAARFFRPEGVATDGAGNVYVADTGNNTIRKISPAGVVTTLAGTAGVYGSADGQGSAASFISPYGIATDGAGNVYVTANLAVRKITPTGLVTTLAGASGAYGVLAVDGVGGSARFHDARGIASDSAGNLYVADGGGVRKISPAGEVTTLAGIPGATSTIVDGVGAQARFVYASAVAVDAANNLYVVDNTSLIRKITPAGVVSTAVGSAVSAGFVWGPLPGGLNGLGGVAVFGDILYGAAGNAVVQVSGLP